MTLKEYERKRDFARTREPAGGKSARAERRESKRAAEGRETDGREGEGSGGSLRFVVQKHAARRLHYDFRLEVDGVLKSWAVAKGPSLDPKTKRLAVHVEDHPLDYADFEGVIAEGNYGAGEVIVWDNGVYSPDEDGVLAFGDRTESNQRMREGLERGKLSFTLRGHKLHGSWTLVRTTREPRDWLLIKHRDRFADAEEDVLELDKSVISGLTVEDLKSGRMPGGVDELSAEVRELVEARGRKKAFPKSIAPMLAGTAEKAFTHPDWVFEPKLDGYRIIALVREGKVTLRSRNNLDYTANFPAVAEALAQQPADELVLDGEVAALDGNGVPDFGLLQQVVNREIEQSAVPLVYYPFDILYLAGRDLSRVPLHARKALLKRAIAPGDGVQLVQVVEADGEALLKAASGLGLEGIIAKRRDSTYEPGTRSKAWLKIKEVRDQDFVVGGWTEGTGARGKSFGSLLLGYYEGDQLLFAGRVGSGFDDHMLERLKSELAGLEVQRAAFAGPVDLEGAKAHWTRPELVVRVKYSNWTRDRRLRAPVFTALRPDIDPREVVREQPAEPPPSVPVQRAAAAADDVEEILERLSGTQEKLVLEVQGERIQLTNLNKTLWPAAGGMGAVTKRDLIRYYTQAAPHLLPHLKDRPLTLTRYPDGITGQVFYQKHWEQRKPAYIDTVRVFSSHNEGDVDFIMANNLPALVALAQQAAIELHPWNSRVSSGGDAAGLPTTFAGSEEAVDASVLNYPDFIVFDLDPYIYSGMEKQGAEPELNLRAFRKTVEIARALKDVLDQLSLSTFVKTSGKTGLHIYVPVLRHHDYDTIRKTCELIGRFLLQQHPKDITMEWSVSKRTGKIFVDHNQNVRGKNMASIYSVRPVPGAPVSMPVRWEELDDIYPPDFNVFTAPERLRGMGDLWADILSAKHDLRSVLQG